MALSDVILLYPRASDPEAARQGVTIGSFINNYTVCMQLDKESLPLKTASGPEI